MIACHRSPRQCFGASCTSERPRLSSCFRPIVDFPMASVQALEPLHAGAMNAIVNWS